MYLFILRGWLFVETTSLKCFESFEMEFEFFASRVVASFGHSKLNGSDLSASELDCGEELLRKNSVLGRVPLSFIFDYEERWEIWAKPGVHISVWVINGGNFAFGGFDGGSRARSGSGARSGLVMRGSRSMRGTRFVM